MPVVCIRHKTRYRYRAPVAFGEHRMMLRPHEAPDQRLHAARIHISPEPSQRLTVHDLFGNWVDLARFSTRARELVFESEVWLEHQPSSAFAACEEEIGGRSSPDGRFAYAEEERPDLERFITPGCADPSGELAAWARRFVRPVGSTSLQTLLSEMTHAIRAELAYGKRLEGPPQTPLETLALGGGSCRDFAVLMIEAARSLGLAARFVSGYVYSRSGGVRRTGGGHTHAWASVYLPSCGWAEFDPTNGIVGNTDLVRVATTRDARQALPLHGAWYGRAEDCLGMDVEVDIAAYDAAAEPPAPMPRALKA